MAASKKNRSTKSKSPNMTALAIEAVSYLSKVQDILPLDDGLIVRDRKAANGLLQFPTEALATTVDILEQEAERLPQFSIDDAREVLAYDEALKKVLVNAEALVVTLQRSLVKRRGAGVQQMLALYSWLNRLSRTDGSVVKHVEALAPHVVLHRRKKHAVKGGGNATTPTSPSPTAVTPTTAVHEATTAPSTVTPAPGATNGVVTTRTPTNGAPVLTNGASAPATPH